MIEIVDRKSKYQKKMVVVDGIDVPRQCLEPNTKIENGVLSFKCITDKKVLPFPAFDYVGMPYQVRTPKKMMANDEVEVTEFYLDATKIV